RQARQFDPYPPDFDEAVHVLPVLQLAGAVQQGDLAAFGRHTLLQERLAAYPFLHSWLILPAWLIEPHVATLRLMSLIFLVGAAGLAFWIGRDLALHGRFPWLAGGLSAGLTLAALPLWVYASVAYLEGAGLLMTMLALWCYGRSFIYGRRSRAQRRWLIAASLAVAGAFFTKYNFGLFVAVAIALNELLALFTARGPGSDAGRQAGAPNRWSRIVPARLFYLAGPAALLILLWFTNLDRLLNFLVYSQAQEGQLTFWRLESWLYYPDSLFRQYLNGPPSWLLVSGGVVYALLRWRGPTARVLLLYVVMSTLMLIAVPQKEPRFLYTIAPALFPLAGAWAAAAGAWLIARFSSSRRPIWSVAVGLAAVGLAIALLGVWQGTAVYHRFTFFPAAQETAYNSSPETADAYAFLAAHTLAQGERLYLVNGWHQFNPYALQWVYYANRPYPPQPFDYWQVRSGLGPAPDQENLADWVASLRRQGISMIATIDGSPAGDYTGWQVAEPLLAQGVLAPVASSPVYALNNWDYNYREAVLAGAFPDRDAWQAARAASRDEFQIQLHIYRLQN
ncbi:hypothetical protein RZS08_05760, partial [Arthrospira platensis SPKY1]|nr:hypothetical protein [Arthrospira platensis SPKY1]